MAQPVNPNHPSLIDSAHVVDEMLGVINVPNSVWIDENGMIVRSAEPAWPDRDAPLPRGTFRPRYRA
jgi:hypothetical protein